MGYEDTLPEITGVSPAYVEQLYDRYRVDPATVDASWGRYFGSVDAALGQTRGPSWARASWPVEPVDANTASLDPLKMFIDPPALPSKDATGAGKPTAPLPDTGAEARQAALDSIRAMMLIRLYRVRGHLSAQLDPLGLVKRDLHPDLLPETHDFTAADMDRPIFLNGALGFEYGTARELLAVLQRNYCGNIGVEYMHINDREERAWIQSKIEGRDKEIEFTPEGKRAILNKLIEAESFEKFLARKYVGTKRFGLDGGEATVPALESIIKVGGALGINEIIIGMPHRGRLNILTNVMQKPFRALFTEFAGGSSTPDEVGGSGDVKYHLGTSTDRGFDGNVVHLSLTPNPSHLEAVNPVVLGKVRAKQMQRGNAADDSIRDQVMPLLLHGDAAFAGQGIVAECFAFSGVRGYNTGGTIHFVVNNQVGFTTSPQFARSSPYPSDMGKIVQAPIFHVNGDDPEAVVFGSKLATEYRQQFNRDVVIDMWCYRRFGHNESDEPAFTQPIMYAAIKSHPFCSTIYAGRLKSEGVVTDETVKAMEDKYVAFLEEEFEAAKGYKPNKADWFEGKWQGLGQPKKNGDTRRAADTGVDLKILQDVGATLCAVPDGFNIHKTLARILDAKKEMFVSGGGFDWATAEALAFGSLLTEDFGVRLSGQDSERGTFSHRHAVFIDQTNETRYAPLKSVSPKFEVLSSPLSEFGVLGFDYGYSLAEPNTLVLWEAQFGDFVNGAQTMIDQFISSGESKWLRSSGLVMLLPHGYEGQGPEHSSARLERFLQACAEDNMQVCNITTPSNYFHALRRQLLRDFRKPLIVMSPKSLLRHKKAVSKLSEMGPDTCFHRVLYDDAEIGSASSVKLKADGKIKRVVMCSGKVYFDLLEERDKRELDDVYLLRVEQLYPYPHEAIVDVLKRFKGVEKIVWCQEEPKNMGSWSFIEPFLEESLAVAKCKPARPGYAGRLASASPATGLAKRHISQQTELVEQALIG
jgi:2-oxoglutarate dehydrogenase E1 component